MIIKFVNCTSHPIDLINLYPEDGFQITKLPKAEFPCHVSTQLTKLSKTAEGIQLYKTTFGEVENVPKPAKNKIYIVSTIVKDALPDRNDLVVPAGVIHNSDGVIIGAASISF